MSKVRLKDVAVEVRSTIKNPYGLPVVGLEHLDPDEIELSRWDDNSENTFTKAFYKGQILFGRRRAYQKKASVATIDGVCSGDITVIAAKEGEIASELLPFVIRDDRLFDFAMEKSAGSLSPRVKWEQLSEYTFELPDDMNKQKELAKIFWGFERTRKAYKAQIEKSDELVKSQFIEMFGEPELALVSDHTIADVADVQVGIVIKPTRFYADSTDGIKAFRSLNVGTMCIKDDDWVYFTKEAMQETQRTVVHTGDILVVRSGNPGTSCVVPPEYDGCNVIDLIIAHPHTDKVLPEYLCAYTNMPHGKNQIDAQQRGVAQKHFNVGMYNELKLILPPLAEQKRFVEFLIQTDKSKLEAKIALKSLNAMQKSLMRKHLQSE